MIYFLNVLILRYDCLKSITISNRYKYSVIFSQPIDSTANGMMTTNAILADDIAAKTVADFEKLPQNNLNKRKVFEIKNRIWDIVGAERFRTITSAYYRGAHGIFVMYDTSNRVPRWLEEIRKLASHDVLILLIGTKADIDRDAVQLEDATIEKADKCEKNSNRKSCGTPQVSYEEGMDLAKQHQLPAFLEISSKDNFRVQDAFCTMLTLLLKRVLLFGHIVPSNDITTADQQARRNNTLCTMS